MQTLVFVRWPLRSCWPHQSRPRSRRGGARSSACGVSLMRRNSDAHLIAGDPNLAILFAV